MDTGWLSLRDQIIIADIMLAAENSTPAKRKRPGSTSNSTKRNIQTEALWAYIEKILHTSLKHLTLHDILTQQPDSHPSAIKLFETLNK